jgi:protein-tyrosine sulfotransferase
MLSDPPILILSCHRSGSTLLRYVLDTHPAIYSPPELFLGSLGTALMQFLTGLDGEVYGADEPTAPELTAALDQTRDFIAERLSAATLRQGKRMWCEKTPDNLRHLRLCDALFPEARYLCLYRHALDVVKSTTEMLERIPSLLPFLYASRGHVVTALLRYWTEWNGTLLRFEAANPSRIHRVRYEDLVGDPLTTLESVFAFLSLDWNRNLVEAIYSSTHDQGMEDPKARLATGIHQDSVGSGSAVSLGGVPEKVLEAMRRLLADLGYPPVLERPAPGAGGRTQDRETRADATDGSLAWLFEHHLRQLFEAQPQVAKSIGSSFQFVVTGEGGGRWGLDLSGPTPKIFSGDFAAAHVICISAPDLRDLVNGKLPSQSAVSEGRIQFAGAFDGESIRRLLAVLRRAPAPA